MPGKGRVLAGNPLWPLSERTSQYPFQRFQTLISPLLPVLWSARPPTAADSACLSFSLTFETSPPDHPHPPGLTSSSSLPRCENGEQCQGRSGHQGQLKRREKAIVSEKGPHAGTKQSPALSSSLTPEKQQWSPLALASAPLSARPVLNEDTGAERGEKNPV